MHLESKKLLWLIYVDILGLVCFHHKNLSMMRATDFHSSFTILLSSSPKSSTMANTAWSTIAGCYVGEENQLENYYRGALWLKLISHLSLEALSADQPAWARCQAGSSWSSRSCSSWNGSCQPSTWSHHLVLLILLRFFIRSCKLCTYMATTRR